MAPLAILTLVATSTGSYTSAGLAVTATAAGTAVGAPLMGALADRHGQRPVLAVSVLVNSLVLVVLAALPTLGRAVLLSLCVLVGMSMPQVGGMARARWLALTHRHAGTAMAFESTVDEVAYVLGPALAGLVASLWGAPAALQIAALADVLAVGAFAIHPTAAAAANAHRQTGPSRPGGTGLLRLVLVPALAMTLMGVFFAAVQSALTVYAATIGRPTTAGLIYALMAVGSAGAALGSAALPERIGPKPRCATSAAGLLLGLLLMSTAVVTGAPVVVLCVAVLLTGLAVGPMLVTLNQVAGLSVPVNRGAAAMAYLSAGSVIGIAVGATASGALADATGAGLGAFAVAAAASGLLLVLSLSHVTGPDPVNGAELARIRASASGVRR